jgi:hypothetical protein
MKWIKYKEQIPEKGQFIVAIRTLYPRFYWVGKWESLADVTDLPTHWIELGEPPDDFEFI